MGKNGSTTPEEPMDPFDPAALRLDQSFLETPGAKKLLKTVPVGKPSRQDYIRVHPGEDFRLSPVAIIKLEEDREVFMVTPTLAPDLPGEFSLATLFTCINRQGVLRLWPVRLPSPDGRILDWHRTEAEAAELAMSKWIRISANMSLRANDIFEATGNLSEPAWPDYSFRQLLQVAFVNRMVDRYDHPVVKRLMGEI
jgi:hypothetical protein